MIVIFSYFIHAMKKKTTTKKEQKHLKYYCDENIKNDNLLLVN